MIIESFDFKNINITQDDSKNLGWMDKELDLRARKDID